MDLRTDHTHGVRRDLIYREHRLVFSLGSDSEQAYLRTDHTHGVRRDCSAGRRATETREPLG